MSVNDHIGKNLCPLKYVTVDHIAARVHTLGKGAMLAKLDIKSAYHILYWFIQRIVCYRQCVGETAFSLTRPCRLVCDQPQLFLVL